MIVRQEFVWMISIIGAETVILTFVIPFKTEEGIVIFGIFAVIWALLSWFRDCKSHDRTWTS